MKNIGSEFLKAFLFTHNTLFPCLLFIILQRGFKLRSVWNTGA